MSVLTAAEAVLMEVGTPLNYREITRLIIERGLWETGGKSPEVTVRGAIGVDIKRHGGGSRFQRIHKGLFGLRVRGLTEPADAKLAMAAGMPNTKKRRSERTRKLSFAEAAEEVLDRFGGRKPMHYRAITEKALGLGLIRTEGQTPAATLYAQVLTEITRKARRGGTSRFAKHGKGFVGLSRWMARGLGFQIEQQNSATLRKLHAHLISMPPTEFETLIGQLLVSIGFEEVSVTDHRGDGGIDVRGMLVVGDVIRIRMAVQVKRWKSNVQSPIVQQLRGSLGTHEQGLIITTSDFSAGARSEAERPNAVPVALMNGEQLGVLLVEHEIGVHHTSYNLIELGKSEDE